MQAQPRLEGVPVENNMCFGLWPKQKDVYVVCFVKEEEYYV